VQSRAGILKAQFSRASPAHVYAIYLVARASVHDAAKRGQTTGKIPPIVSLVNRPVNNRALARLDALVSISGIREKSSRIFSPLEDGILLQFPEEQKFATRIHLD